MNFWIVGAVILIALTYAVLAVLRPMFPDGERKTFTDSGWTTRVIDAPKKVQFACRKAHLAVVDSIKRQKYSGQKIALDRLMEVCFHFIPNEDFPKGHDSYIKYVPNRTELRIPVITIRSGLFLQIIKTGEPAIQDLIKASGIIQTKDSVVQSTAEVIFLFEDES